MEMGFIRPHPHRLFALESGRRSSSRPAFTPTYTTIVYLCTHVARGQYTRKLLYAAELLDLRPQRSTVTPRVLGISFTCWHREPQKIDPPINKRLKQGKISISLQFVQSFLPT